MAKRSDKFPKKCVCGQWCRKQKEWDSHTAHCRRYKAAQHASEQEEEPAAAGVAVSMAESVA